MKTRIIFGAVIALIVVAVIAIGLFFPLIFNVVTAVLGAVCVFEVLYSTGFCKNMFMVGVGAALASVSPFIAENLIPVDYSIIVLVFVLLQVGLALKFHREIVPSSMFAAIALPLMVAYAFRSAALLAVEQLSGIFNLFLLLCFTAVADIGAYFVGVFLGKHKMSPVISPNKTYEGLAGGLVSGILATAVVCFLFKRFFSLYLINIPVVVLLSPLFILLGVFGDLVASYIKRGCGIKDFGDIIPGHGGVMDRVDSILMVAPVFFIVNNFYSLSGV